MILRLELFKEDAFVRGVLVDEQDALALLCDQIAVERFADQAERLLRQVERQLLRLRGVGMGSFGMAAGSGSAFAAGLTGATTGSGCGGAMGEGAFSTGRHRRFDRLWRLRRILHL